MKGIAIVALICGLAAAGSSGYGMVETKPNLESMERERDEASFGSLEEELLRDYRQTLGRLVVGSWLAGLLAIVFGALAIKKGAKGLGAVGLIIGLAGAILGVVIMPQPLVL